MNDQNMAQVDLTFSYPAGRLPDSALEASYQALRAGQTHYVDVPGIGPLREALARYLDEEFAMAYDSNEMLITAGVQEGRFLTIQVLAEKFGQIAIPAVVDPGVQQVRGVRPPAVVEIPVGAANGYLPTMAAIRATLAAGSRLLYLELPSRLTGEVYSREDVEELLALLDEFEAGLICDQGLAPWVDLARFASPAAHSERTNRVAVLGEVWPGIGLDHCFVGYIAAPAEWIGPLRSQKQMMAICTSSASQFAALEAGHSFAGQRALLLPQLWRNRQRAVALAQQLGWTVLSGGTSCLLAVQLTEEENTKSQPALQKAGYRVVDGASFGVPNAIRLAVTTDERIIKALSCLT
jgi:aspartate/methionine/tyrosine aminotransferase